MRAKKGREQKIIDAGAARGRAPMLSLALVHALLGVEAFAQKVPRVGEFFIPVDGIFAARGGGAVGADPRPSAAWTGVSLYSAQSAALALPHSAVSAAALGAVPAVLSAGEPAAMAPGFSPDLLTNVQQVREDLKNGQNGKAHATAGRFFDVGRTEGVKSDPVRETQLSSALLRESLEKHLGAHELRFETPTNAEAQSIYEFMRKIRTSFGVSSTSPRNPKSGDHDLHDLDHNYTRGGGEFVVIKDRRGRIVGTGAMIKLSDKTAEIRKMYLDESLRGKRIGKALLVYLIVKAAELGYSEMELETVPAMDSAIGLYENVGFSPFDARDKHFPAPGVISYKLDIVRFMLNFLGEQQIPPQQFGRIDASGQGGAKKVK